MFLVSAKKSLQWQLSLKRAMVDCSPKDPPQERNRYFIVSHCCVQCVLLSQCVFSVCVSVSVLSVCFFVCIFSVCVCVCLIAVCVSVSVCFQCVFLPHCLILSLCVCVCVCVCVCFCLICFSLCSSLFSTKSSIVKKHPRCDGSEPHLGRIQPRFQQRLCPSKLTTLMSCARDTCRMTVTRSVRLMAGRISLL